MQGGKQRDRQTERQNICSLVNTWVSAVNPPRRIILKRTYRHTHTQRHADTDTENYTKIDGDRIGERERADEKSDNNN